MWACKELHNARHCRASMSKLWLVHEHSWGIATLSRYMYSTLYTLSLVPRPQIGRRNGPGFHCCALVSFPDPPETRKEGLVF